MMSNGPGRSESLTETLERTVLVMTDSFNREPMGQTQKFYVLFKDGALMCGQNGDPEIKIPSELSSEQVVPLVRGVADDVEADTFVMVSEAWLVSKPIPKGVSQEEALEEARQEIGETPPSQHPDRVEVLVLHGGSRNGERQAIVLRFHRNEDGSFREFTEFMRAEKEECTHRRWDLWS